MSSNDPLDRSPAEVTPDSFMVRSLRRRLWKALQEEDVHTAKRAYEASRRDFETWLLEEEEERHRKEQQALQLRSKAKVRNILILSATARLF